MKILFAFILALNLLPSLASAENGDDSYLGIDALTDNDVLKSDDLQIHLVVTDPIGRRNGWEPFPFPHDLNEFPGGYGTNRLGDEEALEAANDESIEFNHGPILKGTYTVTFYGLSSTRFSYDIEMHDSNNMDNSPKPRGFEGYISSGSTMVCEIYIDPTPGAPAPVITKTVTFDTLRQDLMVAQKLNQIGDDKFVNSLIRMINIAEKLAEKCKKYEDKNKHKRCVPAMAVLNMVIKRLEKANRKCDSKNPQLCDEDNDWNDFGKEHRKDHDFDDFFSEWDKDDWHKHKKQCKRFVTDEALKIISEDAQWLIKSLGGEVKK